MKTPPPRTIHGWGIAVYARGRPAIWRAFVGQRFLFETRAEARKEARKLRGLGLCATPRRVRSTIEAR